VAESWHHFLDDAFIHMRYAENLKKLGIFTYNGAQVDFGISSPGYAASLSLSVPIDTDSNPMIPKYYSVFFYFVAIAFVAFLLASTENLKVAGVLFLAALASPSAVRWLTDGMETSIVVLLAITIAWFLNGVLERKNYLDTCLLALLLSIAPFFRVEFFALTLFALVLTIWSAVVNKRKLALAVLAIVLSPLPACAFYLIVFGSILPDTAAAKSLGMELQLHDLIDYLKSILRAHAASPLFVSLMLGSAVFSGVKFSEYMRSAPQNGRRDAAFELLLIAAMFFSFFALLIVRGQVVQGIRHFIWIEVFIVAFLLIRVSRRYLRKTTQEVNLFKNKAFAVLISLIMVTNLYEYYIFKPVFDGRSASFLEMRSRATDDYKEEACVAYDVGFFGYFFGCQLFDMNGLVSGPEVARMSKFERLAQVAENQPTLLFLSGAQFDELLAYLKVPQDQWVILGQYDFPNVSGNSDTHYLLSTPGDSTEY
jgi:hypothetical protein